MRVFIALFFSLLISISGYAAENQGKSEKQVRPDKDGSIVSTELKVAIPSGSMGILFGMRYVNYESRIFYIGGATYSGQLTGSTPGAFTFGGLITGWNFNLGSSMKIQLQTLIGAGGGFTSSNGTNTNDGGLGIEPSLAFAFKLGKSIKSAITGGYLWMPGTTGFSAITAGLRFDFDAS